MIRNRPDTPLVSVVIPVLDEEHCVDEMVRRLRKALDSADARYEIIFVDDGSRDATSERVEAIRAGDPAVKLIRFTRSFGHQAALSAGLSRAAGDAVVTMDGDLQHPPELLPDLLAAWREGADVVQTVRVVDRESAGTSKERLARFFYKMMGKLTSVSVVQAGADFRLLDRRAVAALEDLSEHFVFLRGLVPWMGFREHRVEYVVEERFAGESKYDSYRMLRLALDGIFSFTVLPLRLISLLGLAIVLFGVGFGIFSLVSYFMGRVEDGGWSSIVILILVFGGTQLLAIGVVSEYVGRTYEEVKRRPRYIIDRTEGFE